MNNFRFEKWRSACPLRCWHFKGTNLFTQSATLVIAYIMKTRRMSFKEAIALVRVSRNVRPNLGF